MKEFGFIKVAAATPAVRVADPQSNAQRIIEQYTDADAQGAAVVVFPELALTGYTCGDLFASSVLVEGAKAALKRVADAGRQMGAVAVIGLPMKKDGALYNCAAVIKAGKVLGVVPKRNLSAEEMRHFISGSEGGSISLFGAEVPFGTDLVFPCSDLEDLVLGAEISMDVDGPVSAGTRLARAGATLIVNLSASPEYVGNESFRRLMLASQSARLNCAYLCAQAGEGESTTDLLFSGRSMIAENGEILAEREPYGEGILYADVDVSLLTFHRQKNRFKADLAFRRVPFALDGQDAPLDRYIPKNPFIPEDDEQCAKQCRQIFAIQAQALRRRAEHTRAKKLVVGISGGLDSCLTLLACARALELMGGDKADVLAVTMPCFGTTDRTRTNAEILCRELGVSFRTVNIGESVKRHFEDIGQDFENHDVTFENAQARERTQVLMDIANMNGGLHVGTGDLSELALGFATYSGDHMAMYGVNASIPKTLIRRIVGEIAVSTPNAALKNVLLDILATPVSPELLPSKDGHMTQATENLVGPYELHDFFIYHMIHNGFGPRKIYVLAAHAFAGEYEDAEILKWLSVFTKRFFSQQFKRNCMPEGPKATPVDFSPRGEWVMPSDASSRLWMEELRGLDV